MELNDTNMIEMSISSDGETNNYSMTPQQSYLHSRLDMEYKDLIVNNYMITIIGLFIGTICIVLLVFRYTRKYAFICLLVMFLLWVCHTLYVNYRGRQISNEIDTLLKSL